jgi:hypothetical protein
MKASMSLPFQFRRYQSLFLKGMKDRYAGRVVTVRPDTPTLSLVAFMKNEEGGGWSKCRESVPIPRGIMLPNFAIPNRVDLPAEPTVGAGIDPAVGDEDDAMLVAASIGAESQSQS